METVWWPCEINLAGVKVISLAIFGATYLIWFSEAGAGSGALNPSTGSRFTVAVWKKFV